MNCVHARSACPLLCVMVAALLSGAVPVGAADPPALRIGRVSAPPRLDEFASGRIPEGYAVVTGFRQREPRDGEPVSQATTAYAGYDERNLYVVFVCKQDPRALRAHLVRREAVMGDDIVGVLLDTYRDRRRSYVFIVNPLGVQMDGISSETSDDDWSFDTLWHSEGRVTPDGFVALMAIPFRSLRFSEARTQAWGISFARILPATNETVFWPYMTRKIQSFGEQMAALDGLEQISPGRNLQFIPYAAGAAARFLDEPAATYASRRDGRIGLDAKVIVKDAITLDFTLNPDFSQVESDEPQVTINQRYEVFFPEKRPFFIENATMFVTPETLFFSRRIVDPRFGGRITGKIGRWAVAGVVSDDRAPGQSLGGLQRESGDRAVVGVARA
ncbi:MAG: carbohydrate binding family 9 domain-containing protein, partial [Planctomycetes bacterium]|nr:carbohydrate binding family 9 domain-containing protein [Planctomycetota bacterium]